MHSPARVSRQHRSIGPAQRWVVWVLLQALTALTLAAGVRSVAGPLHWHAGASDDHAIDHAPGEVARHHHEPADGLVLLDRGAESVDDLSGSGAVASAAAALWPARLGGLDVPAVVRDGRAPPGLASAWSDADPSPPEHRPRS